MSKTDIVQIYSDTCCTPSRIFFKSPYTFCISSKTTYKIFYSECNDCENEISKEYLIQYVCTSWMYMWNYQGKDFGRVGFHMNLLMNVKMKFIGEIFRWIFHLWMWRWNIQVNIGEFMTANVDFPGRGNGNGPLQLENFLAMPLSTE